MTAESIKKNMEKGHGLAWPVTSSALESSWPGKLVLFCVLCSMPEEVIFGALTRHDDAESI